MCAEAVLIRKFYSLWTSKRWTLPELLAGSTSREVQFGKDMSGLENVNEVLTFINCQRSYCQSF